MKPVENNGWEDLHDFNSPDIKDGDVRDVAAAVLYSEGPGQVGNKV
ncbi:MAG TPA: hypothetical protein VGJ33_17745 [Candidatus Angelobacter sp.]|jgi:hypothetical protein